MAITRAQQAKQMLQNGGMLVQPGFGGTRQGYKGEGGYQGGATEDVDDRSTQEQTDRTAESIADARSERAKENIDKMLTGLRQTISPSTQPGNRALRTILNIAIPGSGEFFASTIDKQQPDIFGTKTDDDDDNNKDRGDGGLFAPVVQQRPMMSAPETTAPVTSAPAVDLNRVAYRLMADCGADIDDEPRQAYGLGSIVKKATRAVKKVAKSPIGKAAIAYTLTGGLGNLAQGQSFFTGFTSPTSFLGGAGKIFSKEGLRNIAFGKTPIDAMMPGSSGLFGVDGKLSPFRVGAGIAALSALPLLGVGVEEDEEEQPTSPYLGEGLDIAAIRANPRKFQGQAYRLMSEGGSTDLSDDPSYKGWVKVYEKSPEAAEMNEKHSEYLNFYERNKTKQAEGSKEPVAKKVMPLIDMDGQEKDYRETGGFVDMGRMEKADDVPARLSKNEFVFTADAVRNAGDGSVDKGAEVMYNMMKNLEAGGEVSEESQGLEGARKMFQTSQRLEEVL
jgi:hypothetical protein